MSIINNFKENEMKAILKISALAVILIIAMIGSSLAADLKATKFTVNPPSFSKGQTLNFDVEIENPNSRNITGAGDIYFYVTDGTPERSGPGSFLGTTHVPLLAAGARQTVHLTQSYTVPRNAGDQIVFLFYLPPVDPGQEFGPAFEFKYNASCTYSPEPRFRPIGVKPLPHGMKFTPKFKK